MIMNGNKRRFTALATATFIACANARAVPPAPYRIGGTVTIDGTQLEASNDYELIVRVETSTGTVYEGVNGIKAQDSDGLGDANQYIVDVPIYDEDDQPNGAKPGDAAVVTVLYDSVEYDMISPTGGTLAIGASGAATTLDLSASNSTTTGSVTVTISPTTALDAGAKWRVDGGDWRASGTVASGLAAGTHSIEFSDVENLTSPDAVSVSVVAGSLAEKEGIYLIASGAATVTVKTSPEGAGSTTPAAGISQAVAVGSSSSLSVDPEDGYSFVRWNAEPEENVLFADAASTSTTATVSGDAVITAALSFADSISLCPGSLLTIKAEKAGLAEFTKKPKVLATYKDPVNGKSVTAGFQVVCGKPPVDSVAAVWKKNVKLYNRNEYKGVQLGPTLAGQPIADLDADSVVLMNKSLPAGAVALSYKAAIAAPTISEATLSNDVLTVKGSDFGSKAPRLLIEYDDGKGRWKYKACKVDKAATMVHQDASGKAGKSCMKVLENDGMDGNVGDGLVVAAYPALPATATASGYVILDNKCALAAAMIEDETASNLAVATSTPKSEPDKRESRKRPLRIAKLASISIKARRATTSFPRDSRCVVSLSFVLPKDFSERNPLIHFDGFSLDVGDVRLERVHMVTETLSSEPFKSQTTLSGSGVVARVRRDDAKMTTRITIDGVTPVRELREASLDPKRTTPLALKMGPLRVDYHGSVR